MESGVRVKQNIFAGSYSGGGSVTLISGDLLA